MGDLAAFSHAPANWKERYFKLPEQLKLAAFAFLALALVDPRFSSEHSASPFPPLSSAGQTATEGIAIYLVLDQSSSMSKQVLIRKSDGSVENASKLELMKRATKAFIQGDPEYGLNGRPNDLIGLIEFARTAHVSVPLTLDRNTLIDEINRLKLVSDSAQDGTAIGYAIFKTAHLIEATRNYAQDLIGKGKPAYEIKNSVIILVTDGLQDPHPEDKTSRWRQMDPLEVAYAIKELGIQVYIVNIEPEFNTSAFAPHRRLLQKAVEITGGKLFMASESNTLADIYSAIDAIVKSTLPVEAQLYEKLKEKIPKDQLPGLYHTFYLAPWLIGLGICSLILSVILECTLLRRVP